MGLVLGIESSCDDLAAAVVRDGDVIVSSVVHAQDAVHEPYGGVVPELASRDHVRHVYATVDRALDEAGVSLDDLDGVGVTSGPGLIGSLLVGLCFAKSLAYRLAKPLVGVHHIEGHLASARLGSEPLGFPFLGLVVSGGHTALYEVGSLARIGLLGQTRDDAAGEAFDKVAKRLGLPYPGGREIDREARDGDAKAFALPRPLLADPGLDFSFSGLKTAVALEIDRREAERGGTLTPSDIADLSASFQEAAVNSRLRARMAEAASGQELEVRFPPVRLCTDNAAMIAAVADRMLAEGRTSSLELEAFSRVPLGLAQS
jgi:N6-L-threonylcarbamoyladenine synthase